MTGASASAPKGARSKRTRRIPYKSDKGVHTEAPNSDINVTPLVDVCLVLLIIFMVVTPMLQKGQAVQLPLASNPEKKPDAKGQIMVVVTADKSATGYISNYIWIEKQKFPTADFADKIREEFDRNPGGDVMVKADSRLTFGEVKDAILKVRDAGFKNVGLIAQKKDQG